jgi:hypothetical protein
MTDFPFKVGYCLNCAEQTMIPMAGFGPGIGKPGTKVCWIVLCNEAGDPVTRVGTITLCSNCNATNIDMAKMVQRLEEEPLSGYNLNEEEAKLPIKKLEVVKVFGA